MAKLGDKTAGKPDLGKPNKIFHTKAQPFKSHNGTDRKQRFDVVPSL